MMSNDLVPLPTLLGELDDIRAEMGTPAYWKDETKQARYRELVARRDAAVSSEPEETSGTSILPIASPREFEAETGTAQGYSFYLDTMRAAADVVFAIPAGDQAVFIADFEALPDEITTAALEEFMRHRPAVDWCSEEAVANFKKLAEGAVLVREWGHEARRNMAVVRERLWRVAHALGDEHLAHRFLDWHAELSTAAKVALYRKLVA